MCWRAQTINAKFLEARNMFLFSLKTFLNILMEGRLGIRWKGAGSSLLPILDLERKKNHSCPRMHFAFQNRFTEDNKLIQTLPLTAWVGIYLLSRCVVFDLFSPKANHLRNRRTFLFWVSGSFLPCSGFVLLLSLLWNIQTMSCETLSLPNPPCSLASWKVIVLCYDCLLILVGFP